jgi:hypothetical protein
MIHRRGLHGLLELAMISALQNDQLVQDTSAGERSDERDVKCA